MSHSRQTEHYGLPLYDGTDIINPLTDFNNANEAIDEAVYNANQRSVSAENTAEEAKDIAEGYDSRVTQAIQTANDAMTLANNTQDMIAEDFDPMKEGGYQVGDFVIYNGVLYRFINAHTGAWDASDVQVSPVLIDALEDVVEEGKQAIEEAVEEAEEEIAGQTEKVTKTQAMIAQPFDENKVGGYAVDDVVTYADKLYKFTSAHSGAWTGLDVEQIDVIEVVSEAEAVQTEKITKTQAMIAQAFDENKVGGYAVDDVVTYADKLYKFTSAHSGAWTGLDVTQVGVTDIIDNVNERVDDLNSDLTLNGQKVIWTGNIDVGDGNLSTPIDLSGKITDTSLLGFCFEGPRGPFFCVGNPIAASGTNHYGSVAAELTDTSTLYFVMNYKMSNSIINYISIRPSNTTTGATATRTLTHIYLIKY